MTQPSPSLEHGCRMPVIYVGHGSPLNVLGNNPWSLGYSKLGEMFPRPDAILAISAHWYVNGSYLAANEKPRTIHDFAGFPPELYEIQYPAPGNLELANSVREHLGRDRVSLTNDWGLDHGVWTVLYWMYPKANIPVIQLSIDRQLEIYQHFELGHSLAELRDQNILILASGNIVHNLPDAFRQMQSGTSNTPDWASHFDETVKQALLSRDTEKLFSIYPGTSDGLRAHPSPDHWLPLVYAVGATDSSDNISFPIEGFDLGSLSMRCVIWDT